ncbi:uncharacterized protein [Rutidosis leptorrhynchoides]|uniref:uncharacterized protein n=1 Tax=Rutidosis leptorrhynchoides TaxID=125765 RepID=UPI003A998B36
MTKFKTVLFIELVILLVWLNYTTMGSLDSQVEAAATMKKKCIDKERHALLDFKALLQYPDFTLSTWITKEEDDCCEWYGVTCNHQTGHVTELDLFYCYLKGNISPSLVNLTYLTRLDLSSNHLYGTIPKSIGSLTNLRFHHLSDNFLSGTIPMSIGLLTELRHLGLYDNSFSGTIPTSMGHLTKLTSLDLYSNSFYGTIPIFIGALTKLRYLGLGLNSLSGNIPRSIGSLTKLRVLDLSDNSFSGTIPLEFGNLTNLEELGLENIGSCNVVNLDWMSHLSHLWILNMNGLSQAKQNHWVNIFISLKSLTFLSLERCNLSQVKLPYSSSFVNSSSSSSSITNMHLEDNNLNSSIFHWLFPLTRRLEELHLAGNNFDRIPKYFGNLCSLRILNLNRNSGLIVFSDFLKNLAGCTSKNLQSLNASSSQFTGSLSDEVQIFSSLIYLNLQHNQLNGTISEVVWDLPNLDLLDVSSNSLSGGLSINFRKSKISYMEFSNNSFIWVTSKPQNSNSKSSYIKAIDLSSCNIGPRFPTWIRTLENLTRLNVANNGISETISTNFSNLFPSHLQYLNLSSNNITGSVTDISSNFDNLQIIDLSSNRFYGVVTNVSSNLLVSLDLSRNKFHGGISFLCNNFMSWTLTHLDLSNNSFSGQLPDCLWFFGNLKVLNLGYNKFSGRLPSPVVDYNALEVLNLYNNKFSGELPLLLKNFTKLTFLDLGYNKFFGNVPIWIGELSGLYVLGLNSNDFFGHIPLQLCQLVNLQILDLSMNNLNGTVPSCINNLTAMVRGELLTTRNKHQYEGNYSFDGEMRYMETTNYVDHAMIWWQGNIQEFSSNLRLLKSIDLSSNNLTGKIPDELTDLLGLRALNLSKNALVGEIPPKIGKMKELQILDISKNYISGGLPSNMTQMNFLNYIDVSYNKLTGRIPSGTQFQTSEPSRYIGNRGLCGPPIGDHCTGDRELQVSPPIGESHGDQGDNDELQRLFYIGGTTGFVVGFWLVCSALLVNRRGRHKFFYLLDSLENWVYVMVMVFVAKF